MAVAAPEHPVRFDGVRMMSEPATSGERFA
jgi:hypothetical protein